MSGGRVFAAVGLLAMIAGAALWLLNAHRGAAPLAAGAIYSARFDDAAGGARSIGDFRGRVVVLNFWATWCPPCRAEMPGFSRLQSRWSARNVQFVGLTGDDPTAVARYLHDHPVAYPVLLGGSSADEWARRLGDLEGGLPYTVILGPDGAILRRKVGLYFEDDLQRDLERLTAKIPQKFG